MYKTDLHIHTAESSRSARMNARKVFKLYFKSDIDTIVITDHCSEANLHKLRRKKWEKQVEYMCYGYEEALKLTEKYELNVLFGIEVTLKETNSDYLIYGITKEFLLQHEKLYEISLKELHRLCEENGFLLIQAHPFRDGIKRAAFEDVDGYEGYNGCHDVDSRNEKAMHYAINSKKIITAGSDFHCKKDLARGAIETEKEIKTNEDLIKALKGEKIKIVKVE